MVSGSVIVAGDGASTNAVDGRTALARSRSFSSIVGGPDIVWLPLSCQHRQYIRSASKRRAWTVVRDVLQEAAAHKAHAAPCEIVIFGP
jgi:hypothetical protein